MPLMRNLLVLFLCLFPLACGKQSPVKAPTKDYARLIEPLIDPAKLATLGDRGANPRVQKAVAFLWQAKRDGLDPGQVAADAVVLIGWGKTDKGRLTAAALVRNLTIAERLGSVTPPDIEAMERGRAPTIRSGPYTNDIISVDHIIPRSVVPELDNVIANLEFMPLKMNRSKSDRVGDRQMSLARQLRDAGLLSEAGYQRVAAASGQ
jgi:hypothetical protein